MYPALLATNVVLVCQRERHQQTAESSHDQDDADNIKLPEQRDDQPEWAEHLVGRAVVRQVLVPLGATVCKEECDDQRNCQDWESGQSCLIFQRCECNTYSER